MQKNITTIVFDMGQVLIHWQPLPLIAHMNLTEEDKQLLMTELFQSVEWVQSDHGTIELPKMVEQVNARLPKRLHPAVEEIVMGWWRRPLFPIEGMGELVKELKENGYKIYLLSNASVDLRKYFGRIPGSAFFDGLMVSAEEKMAKPQYEIYKNLYSRFRLEPEKCIFIDDSPANIEAALCTGMDGIIFRGDAKRLRGELRAKGVKVAPATEETGKKV